MTPEVHIGASLALPVGFLLGHLPAAPHAFESLLSFFHALTPIALIPLVIVCFGIGEFAKLIVLSPGRVLCGGVHAL